MELTVYLLLQQISMNLAVYSSTESLSRSSVGQKSNVGLTGLRSELHSQASWDKNTVIFGEGHYSAYRAICR